MSASLIGWFGSSALQAVHDCGGASLTGSVLLFGILEIRDQLELSRLLDQQIARFGAAQQRNHLPG